MRASTRGRTRPSRSPPRPRARRSPAVRPSAERRRVQGRCFPSWAWLRSCHHTSRTRSVATESERRRPTLLSRGRVAIRGVLAWKGTHAGLFLLLVGGGVGLPLPEDLTLLAAGVLAHQHVLRLRAGGGGRFGALRPGDGVARLSVLRSGGARRARRRSGAALARAARPAGPRALPGVARVDRPHRPRRRGAGHRRSPARRAGRSRVRARPRSRGPAYATAPLRSPRQVGAAQRDAEA